MADQQRMDGAERDPVALSRNLMEAAQRTQALFTEMAKGAGSGVPTGSADSVNLGGAFVVFSKALLGPPEKLAESSLGLWRGYLDLWGATPRRLVGQDVPPVVEPEPGDRR